MSVASQIRKAKKFENLGAFEDATDTYKNILLKFPQNYEAKKGLKRIQHFLLTSDSSTATNQKSNSAITPKMRDRLWNMHLAKDYYTLLNYIEKYLSYNPEDYELLFMAGSCCRHVHDFHKAMDYLKKALAHEPENFGANLEVARIFADSGLSDLARQTFEHVMKAYPSKWDTHLEYGKWLEKIEEYEGAESLYKDAIKIFPEKYEFINNLGELYFTLGKYHEAHESFTTAMNPERRVPRIVKQILHANRMNAAVELGYVDSINESLPEVEDLVAKNPNTWEVSATAKFNLALYYLRVGNVEKGWRYYQDRYKRSRFPSPERKFKKPRIKSLGEISGGTVLIWREQGVGDELMFYNLLSSLIAKTDCKYLIECEPRLVSVLQKSFPDLHVRPEEYCEYTHTSPNDDFDAHFPLGDLPILLNVSQKSSETLKPWIKIDSNVEHHWRDKLSSEKLNIGFAWESGLKDARRNASYTTIEFFDDLIGRSEDNWICLQYTATPDDLQLFSESSRSKIFLPDIDLKNDFENVSGIMKNCDIILTPRTTVLSMAAAVGCPSATFYTGWIDLGVTTGPGSILKPPLFPQSTCLDLKYGLADGVRNKALREYFSKQIERVRSRNID